MAADIAVIMGSKSDLPSLKGAFDTLKKFGLSFEARVLSAHRTPDAAAEYAKNAEERGIKIIICAAGMAAHLGGVIAAHTILPVIGIPMAGAVSWMGCASCDGPDASGNSGRDCDSGSSRSKKCCIAGSRNACAFRPDTCGKTQGVPRRPDPAGSGGGCLAAG